MIPTWQYAGFRILAAWSWNLWLLLFSRNDCHCHSYERRLSMQIKYLNRAWLLKLLYFDHPFFRSRYWHNPALEPLSSNRHCHLYLDYFDHISWCDFSITIRPRTSVHEWTSIARSPHDLWTPIIIKILCCERVDTENAYAEQYGIANDRFPLIWSKIWNGMESLTTPHVTCAHRQL